MSIFDTQSGSSTSQSTTGAQQNQTSTGTTQQVAQGQGATANTYDANQQAAQSSLAPLAQQVASGTESSNYGLPQSVADWAQNQFNTTTAPSIANQYGAGSAALPMAQMQLNLGLASQDGQATQTNAINSLNAVQNYAYTPTGAVNSTAQQQQGNNTSTGTSDSLSTTAGNSTSTAEATDYGGLLDLLGYSIAGAGSGGLTGSTGTSGGSGSSVPGGDTSGASGASGGAGGATDSSGDGSSAGASGTSSGFSFPTVGNGSIPSPTAFANDPMAFINQIMGSQAPTLTTQSAQNQNNSGQGSNINLSGASIGITNQGSTLTGANVNQNPSQSITAPFSPTETNVYNPATQVQPTSGTTSGMTPAEQAYLNAVTGAYAPGSPTASSPAQAYLNAITAAQQPQYALGYTGAPIEPLGSGAGGYLNSNVAAANATYQAAQTAYSQNPNQATLSALQNAEAKQTFWNGQNPNSVADNQSYIYSTLAQPITSTSVSGSILGGGGSSSAGEQSSGTTVSTPNEPQNYGTGVGINGGGNAQNSIFNAQNQTGAGSNQAIVSIQPNSPGPSGLIWTQGMPYPEVQASQINYGPLTLGGGMTIQQLEGNPTAVTDYTEDD